MTLDISEESHGTIAMQATIVHNNAGHFNPCAVTVCKPAWENETGQRGLAAVPCRLDPRGDPLLPACGCRRRHHHGGIPEWISEGSALWLAASDTGTEELQIHDMWKKG